MHECERLEKMLHEEVIPEIEGYIDTLFEKIAETKNASNEDRDALQEMQELRDDFNEMLRDLQSGEMESDECAEIIEELTQMLQQSE